MRLAPVLPRARRMPSSRAFLWLLALAITSGCSSRRDVLATVGSEEIRIDDFLSASRALASRYPGPPDSAKVHLLRDLIQRELLVQGALRTELARDTAFLDFRRRAEDQILRQRLFEDIGGSGVPVSEAEIETLYRWRATESRARVIFALAHPFSVAAQNELARGIPFADVANRFNPTGYVPPGGDLGFLAPGMLQEPLDSAIRTGRIGRVEGPIEAAGQGWFLVRVEERRKREAPPLSQERQMLEAILRTRKQRELMLRSLDRLSAAYQVRLVPGGPQELVARVTPSMSQGLTPPPLTPAQSAMAVARYRGGVYTMGDAFQDLANAQGPRLNVQMLPLVERWIELRAIERTARLEALHRHYQEEPEVRRALRERTNDYLLENYLARQVLAVATVDEADVREAYARRTSTGSTLAEARVLIVALQDSAAALRLSSAAAGAGGLEKAAAALGVPIQSQTQTVQFPTQVPLWQQLEPLFQATPVGGTIGPFPMPGAWVVLQLLSKATAPASPDAIPPAIRSDIETQVLERKRAQRMAALSDSLRRVIPVSEHLERLQKVPWPSGPGIRES